MLFAIIKSKKPTTIPEFRCIARFFWQQSPKCQSFDQRTTPKITHFRGQLFNKKHCPKIKILHLRQTLRPALGIWREIFLSLFPQATLQPFYWSQSRVSQVVLFTPQKNSGNVNYSRNIEPFHFLFPSFFCKCRATQYYQENMTSIELFTSQNQPKLPWQALESFHKVSRETASAIHRHIGYEADLASHSARNRLSPLASFKGLPLPTFQLKDASLGAFVEENGSKKPHKAANLPQSSLLTR